MATESKREQLVKQWKDVSSKEAKILSTIFEIDTKLDEMPASAKTGDNVIYAALWSYRGTLMKEIIDAGYEGF